MIKVKTFASPLKIFHAKKEIEELDAIVNKFIEVSVMPPRPMITGRPSG
jgi:hypothetical protein